MKLTPAISTCFAALAALSLATSASAQISLDFVNVGNAGNPNDPSTGYGAVSYEYRIGKYEVTLNQYTAFLNAVAATDTYNLYNPGMATDVYIAGIARSGVSGSYSYAVIGDGNRPVTYVSWFDAARFTNWLHNGQPIGAQGNGTTETGAYALNGATSGVGFSKSAGAQYWVPSENEWYKAAYYQPPTAGGDADGYWLYPMQTNSTPYSDQPPGTTPDNTRVGNFYADDGLANGYDDGYAVATGGNVLTPVGAYLASDSYYGTYDQGGNVWEWNDAIFDDAMFGARRGVRGGFWQASVETLAASDQRADTPGLEDYYRGFRIASGSLPVQSRILFQHTGSTNPDLEGWQAIGFSSDATAGPIDDAGTPAWFSNDTSTAGGSYRFYVANVTDAQAASATSLGWTLTTRLRVTAVSTTSIGSPFAGFSNGPRTFLMFFAGKANGVDVEVSLYGSTATFTVPGGMSAYHVYSLVYDPVAGSADLFVDGVERLSNYTGNAVGQQLVDWGTGSSGYDGSANFNLVQFSITRPLPAWRQLQGLSSNGSQDLANPSGDGIANLLKYAFNIAPNAGDLATPNIGVLAVNGTAGLPSSGVDAQGRLVIKFVRRHAETLPGISYLVETGGDLANLQPLSLSGATVVPINAIWERVTVTDLVVTSKRFGRVRVGTDMNDFNVEIETSAATLGVQEGSSGNLGVRLTAQPQANTTVTVGTTDSSKATASPITLTFTTANWHTFQTVTVSGVNDANTMDETTTLTLTSPGLGNRSVAVNVTDDDLQSIATTVSTLVVGEAGSGTFGVRLTAQPASTVTVSVASGDIAKATATPISLTFTAINWNAFQDVTVGGVNDADTNNESVTMTLSSAGVPNRTVTVVVNDDD